MPGLTIIVNRKEKKCVINVVVIAILIPLKFLSYMVKYINKYKHVANNK